MPHPVTVLINMNSSLMTVMVCVITKHQTVELLTLVESYGQCNAFIDHDQLLNLLYTSWCLLSDGYAIEKKITTKRIKNMKEDKKTDPDVLARQENLLIEIEQKKAHVLVAVIRLRTMLSIPLADFKSNPNFDYMKRNAENNERRKYLLKDGQKK